MRKTLPLIVGGIIAISFTRVGAEQVPQYRLRLSHGDLIDVLEEHISSSVAHSARLVNEPRSVGGTASPGTAVGFTYRDAQHVNSTGRQVDEAGGTIQAVFTDHVLPEVAYPGREAKWNRLDVTGSPAPVSLDNGSEISALPLGNLLTPSGTALPRVEYGGYPNLEILPSGAAIAFYHHRHQVDPADWDLQVAIDGATGAGVFLPTTPIQPYDTTVVMWPKGAVEIACGDTLVHLIATGASWTGPQGREVWYWRGTISGTSIAWESPVLIDTCRNRSAVIEAHGDRVAVAYIRLFGSSDSTLDRNVLYRMSTDCGATWAPPVNLTNYATGDGPRAWTDVGAVFDEDGVWHVTWNTLSYIEEEGIYWLNPGSVAHWNSQRNTIRTIAVCDWDNYPPFGCSNGTNSGSGSAKAPLCQPTLSVKPAGLGAGTGIAEELLYAFWVQFGPTLDDCATEDSAGTTGGYVNGEIYMSVSSDDGFTWDRPQNLTGTETPDCLPGDCDSEHWVTASARADSALYISFLDDGHAGSNFISAEGTWCLSPYVVMTPEARTPVAAPVIHVGPAHEFHELHADTTGIDTLLISIGNRGNATLNFDILVTADHDGPTHVQVNGGASYSGSVTAGADAEDITIVYDGIGLTNPSEHTWRLEITSNDETNDPGQSGSAIDIMLNVFVANPWYTCTRDTISTGQHRLTVSSCLELGNQGAGGGLHAYASGAEWIYDASPVLAWMDGPHRRAYRDIFMRSTLDRGRDSNNAFRALSEIDIGRGISVPSGDTAYPADVASGVASSTDSLFQIDWQVTTFSDPGLAGGAVMQYLVTSRTGTSYSGVHLGAAADLDIDTAASANDGIASESLQYVGAVGVYPDTSGTFARLPNYAALFHLSSDSTCSSPAVGGQVLDNVDYVYPEDGYHTDSLYEILNRMDGWNSATLQADSASDVNAVMLSQHGQALGPDDTLEFAFGLAVSDISQADLEARMAVLRSAFNPACGKCPIELTGDVNLSGALTSADIIALVNFVFKGGDEPEPCPASGDVNCSGSITSADLIYMVNHVFKGQDGPCDVCAEIAAGNWGCP